MYCPKCRVEYGPDFTRCAEHEIAYMNGDI